MESGTVILKFNTVVVLLSSDPMTVKHIHELVAKLTSGTRGEKGIFTLVHREYTAYESRNSHNILLETHG